VAIWAFLVHHRLFAYGNDYFSGAHLVPSNGICLDLNAFNKFYSMVVFYCVVVVSAFAFDLY